MFSASFLLYLYAFSIFTSIGTAWCVYKIWRLKLGSPLTWSLFLAAQIMRTLQIGYSLFFLNDIATFLSTYPAPTVVYSLANTAVISILMFLFALNSYVSYKRVLPPNYNG